MLSRIEDKKPAGPVLSSILKSETASPFVKAPSSAYQIEYTSNIINPEAINSLAMSEEITFGQTQTTSYPDLPKTTIESNGIQSTSQITMVSEGKRRYVQPETYSGWSAHNLIIEGHSKVKTYGLKNDDPIENNLPKIRPIQAKENPIVERVDQGPEFNIKHLETKNHNFLKSSDGGKNSVISNLLSLFDTSFSR